MGRGFGHHHFLHKQRACNTVCNIVFRQEYQAMSTRTVRLDDDAEQTLARLRDMTDLSISEVLKLGLSAFETAQLAEVERTPFDVFRQLDLGEGGWALAPAREAKTAVTAAIRRKRRR